MARAKAESKEKATSKKQQTPAAKKREEGKRISASTKEVRARNKARLAEIRAAKGAPKGTTALAKQGQSAVGRKAGSTIAGVGKKGTAEKARRVKLNLLKPKVRAGSITTTGTSVNGTKMLQKHRRKVVGEVSRGST